MGVISGKNEFSMCHLLESNTRLFPFNGSRCRSAVNRIGGKKSGTLKLFACSHTTVNISYNQAGGKDKNPCNIFEKSEKYTPFLKIFKKTRVDGGNLNDTGFPNRHKSSPRKSANAWCFT